MSNTVAESQAQAQAHAPEAQTSVVDAPLEQPPLVVAIEVDKNEAKEKGAKERKKKKAKPPSHPPYFQMIKEAITAQNEKTGSSPYAIAKYMEENHKPVLPSNFRKILGLQLKNSVSKGKLIKIKASFKLSDDNSLVITPRTTKTRAARANAASKPKEAAAMKKRKVKSREINKIKDPSPIPSFANVATRGRRSKRSTPSGKWRQLKSMRGPIGKKAFGIGSG